MANICSNAVRITGTTQQLNALLDKICIERNPNMLVTNGFRTNEPNTKRIESLKKNPLYKNVRVENDDYYTTVLYEEKATHDNFGGAIDDVNIDIEGMELDLLESGEVNLNYATNWNPLDIVDKLAKIHPELTFRHYYSEPGCSIYGYAEYENGEAVDEDSPHLSNVNYVEWLEHHAPEDFSEELGLIDEE